MSLVKGQYEGYIYIICSWTSVPIPLDLYFAEFNIPFLTTKFASL